MLRLLLGLTLALGTLTVTGCHTGKSPEMRVLGARTASASHLFVQVTNPATRPMRLTKLEYTFASARDGATVAQGEVPLEREIPAGAAIVVEVPFDAEASEVLTLRGKLTAELDQIVRTFKLDADIQPQ